MVSLLLIIVFPLSQVLIIGGGDGGVLREVVKNPLVESVVLCEIDEVCFEVATAFLVSRLFQNWIGSRLVRCAGCHRCV